MGYRDLVTAETIGGKPVYIFEKHNFALIPWAQIAAETPEPVRLLTLDYHTDTRPAFVGYACKQFPGFRIPAPSEWEPIAAAEVAAIRRADIETVELAASRLRYDEHIDAAVRAGILDVAFVVAYQDNEAIRSNEQIALDGAPEHQPLIDDDGNPTTVMLQIRRLAEPPFTYAIPDDRIVVLPTHFDYPWLDRDDLERSYCDAALESLFLADRLGLIDEICTSGGVPRLFELPFILDIDLDYFNTRQAISPADAQVFHDLIRRAVAITIAREPQCVENLQLEGEGLSSAYLEQKVMEHVAAALAT